MQELDFWINFIANVMTVFASGLAIFIYVVNKDKISIAINSILNYSNQLTLTDLKFKIERLNEFNANDTSQKVEVVNILHEIEGQILGNNNFKTKLATQLAKIENLTSNTRLLTEAKKRSLVSELKESIRTLDVSNFGDRIN